MHNSIHAYANYPYRVWYTVIHHYRLCAAILKSFIHKKWGYMFSENNILAARRYGISLLVFNSISSSFAALTPGISSWMQDLVWAMYYFNLLDKRRRPLLTRKVADFFNKGWWKKNHNLQSGLRGKWLVKKNSEWRVKSLPYPTESVWTFPLIEC